MINNNIKKNLIETIDILNNIVINKANSVYPETRKICDTIVEMRTGLFYKISTSYSLNIFMVFLITISCFYNVSIPILSNTLLSIVLSFYILMVINLFKLSSLSKKMQYFFDKISPLQVEIEDKEKIKTKIIIPSEQEEKLQYGDIYKIIENIVRALNNE